MNTQNALVTIYDLTRLGCFVAGSYYGDSKRTIDLRTKLLQLLENAEVTRPWQISPDVVTMNSAVRMYNCRKNEDLAFRLVFPTDAELSRENVSVLTPLGIAVLGRKVGDIVPGDLRVEEIPYQPEAVGDFHL